MGSANILPQGLSGVIRPERPHGEASKRLRQSATLDAEGVYRLLETTGRGLTIGDAQLRLTQYGPNVLASDSRSGIGRIFLHAVLNPLVILLTTLVSLAAGDRIPADVRIVTAKDLYVI